MVICVDSALVGVCDRTLVGVDGRTLVIVCDCTGVGCDNCFGIIGTLCTVVCYRAVIVNDGAFIGADLTANAVVPYFTGVGFYSALITYS